MFWSSETGIGLSDEYLWRGEGHDEIDEDELAYLTTAVDGRLDDQEIAAYKEVIARLKGTSSISNADLDKLFDRYGGNVEFEEITERVQKIAPTLPQDLRPLAFKLAIGLSVADLDASDDEADLQSVLAETNPRYHALISNFEGMTGVPVIMNTSFNLRGEPIVTTPDNAMNTFFASGLDTLVLGSFVVRKDGENG